MSETELPGGTVTVITYGGLRTTLAPGERLDIFRDDGSRFGTLVYGTPDEIDAAERRLASIPAEPEQADEVAGLEPMGEAETAAAISDVLVEAIYVGLQHPHVSAMFAETIEGRRGIVDDFLAAVTKAFGLDFVMAVRYLDAVRHLQPMRRLAPARDDTSGPLPGGNG